MTDNIYIKIFSASWCSPCKSYKQSLSKQSPVVPVEFLDIDECSDLAKQYNIRSVPTTLIFKDDEVVRTLTGPSTADKLNSIISEYK